MAKPFKFVETPKGTPIPKEPLPTPPPLIIQESIQKGIPLDQVIANARTPDRAVGKGEKKDISSKDSQLPVYQYPNLVEWPKAGPSIDSNKAPYKWK